MDHAEPVVRPDSRVGKVLAEFKGMDDWASRTVMRHSLAIILQANVRGWLVRKKWRSSREGLVASVKASMAAERKRQEARLQLKAELEKRAMTRKQKDKASGILTKVFGLGAGGAPAPVAKSAMARGKWGKVSKNIELVVDQEEQPYNPDPLDVSDSDASDMGVEDVAMVKLRAKTPPWQKVEQSQWEGQWAKLNTRQHRGNLDVVWDLADSANRVAAVRRRRAARAAGIEQPPYDPDDGDADESVADYDYDLAGGVSGRQKQTLAQRGVADFERLHGRPYDPAADPLPAAVVTDLLLPRYLEKYARLGLMDGGPGSPVSSGKGSPKLGQMAAAMHTPRGRQVVVPPSGLV